MEIKDVSAVSRVLCSCYEWLARREGYTPEQVSYLVHKRGSQETVRRESKEQTYLVACLGDSVAGMVAVAGDEVTKLYVEPSHHHEGMGAALLASAESLIREAGFDVMYLGTTPNTVPFYEKMGMSRDRVRRPPSGPFAHRDVVVMTKVLR